MDQHGAVLFYTLYLGRRDHPGSMMKVTASENLKRALAPLKPHQIYLGRYLLFLVLGLIQSG